MGEKVGSFLTVERVRELNAKDFFYRILKDNPKVLEVYPGIENELLEGAIDHHIHAYPDFVHRAQDMLGVALDAARAKMRAVGFKDHYNHTGGCAYLVEREIEAMVSRGELERGISVFGGMGLNFGMNPKAVEIGLQYPNTKMLWFPTFHSAGYFRAAGKDYAEGIPLVGKGGRVRSEVVEIIQMAAEKKVGIGLGHTDFEELLPLAEKTRELGARAVLDHPLLELNKLSMDEMRRIADLGVYVGTYCQPMIPSLYQPVADPFETVEAIKAIGPSRCIIASDFGQVLHMDSIDGVRIFIRALLGFGISREDILTMIRDNPARLLYLDQ